MTKDQYFEMCEAMDSEPIESEIPIDFEDLPNEVQSAISIYNRLQDNWDFMAGEYLGKNFSGLTEVFDILDIEKHERRPMYDIIVEIDRIRSKLLSAKKKSAEKKKPL